MSDLQIETARFADDGETVNNPELPLILMRGTEAAEAPDPAAWFEQRFAANGWGASWRWGVYPFHHLRTSLRSPNCIRSLPFAGAVAFPRSHAELFALRGLPGPERRRFLEVRPGPLDCPARHEMERHFFFAPTTS